MAKPCPFRSLHISSHVVVHQLYHHNQSSRLWEFGPMFIFIYFYFSTLIFFFASPDLLLVFIFFSPSFSLSHTTSSATTFPLFSNQPNHQHIHNYQPWLQASPMIHTSPAAARATPLTLVAAAPTPALPTSKASWTTLSTS